MKEINKWRTKYVQEMKKQRTKHVQEMKERKKQDQICTHNTGKTETGDQICTRNKGKKETVDQICTRNETDRQRWGKDDKICLLPRHHIVLQVTAYIRVTRGCVL